jgi:hypothetical protein
MDAWTVLGRLLLAATLGAVGQLIRVVVGLKKESDAASAAGKTLSANFSAQKLFVSLAISLMVGAVAGVLSAVATNTTAFDSKALTAFIGVGYAGTDFIEGFMSKALPSAPPTTP